MGKAFSHCLWALILLAASTPTLAPAQDKDSDYNITPNVGWGNCYRPGEWVPVDFNINIQNLKDNFAGRLIMAAQQDSLTNMTLVRDFVVMRQTGSKDLMLVTKIKFAAESCDLSIQNDKGRQVWHSEYGLWSGGNSGNTPLKAIQNNELLIGLSKGREASLRKIEDTAAAVGDNDDNLRRSADPNRGAMIGSSVSVSFSGPLHPVYLKEKMPRMLPWHWTGYSCLNVLILYDMDWTALHPDQSNAIAQWVRNGGKLLIALDSHPLPPDHPLARLLPFAVGPAKQVALTNDFLGPVRPGSGERTYKPAASATCWTLTDATTKGFRTVLGTDKVPLMVAGQVGFGSVAVLGANPAQLTGLEEQPIGLWVTLLNKLEPRIRLSEGGTTQDNSSRQYQFQLSPAALNTNAVMDHLLNIRELKPLSIWWVIGLLAALAMVLGPIDYLVLKKLDRLPLTWITSTACIAIFTVGAWYGVQKIRGGDMQVRQVSVVDGVQGMPGSAWATAYTGIYAPDSDNFRLDNLRPRDWWSALSPERDSYLYQYRGERASRNIYCSQGEYGLLPTDLPINIWSMQCLLNEAPLESMPLSAKMRMEGSEAILTVNNLTDQTIKGGMLRLAIRDLGTILYRQMPFDEVPPQGSVTFRGVPVQPWSPRDGWGLLRDSDTAARASNFAPLSQGTSQRTAAIDQYLADGAAVVCVQFENAPVHFSVVKRTSNFDHIQLVRLVIPSGDIARSNPQP